jgi:iron(III) transport system ATP-binding protein
MPRINLTEVDKSYVPGQLAVDGLNLDIPDGSFTSLLGPSGCGKTTTLRMIAGLEHPTAGEIEVGDRVLDSIPRGVFVPPERRQMGLMFQSYALWPHLTVRKNADFGLRMQKVPTAERVSRTDEVLQLLHIDHLADRYPAQLSGGQQQRVALARMLVVNPSVLLLDEPLSNLDARLRLEMRAELKRIHEKWKTTIVFVTHDQMEAMTLATHIAVMNEGVLQQFGAPMQIYDRPVNRFVAEFVGSPPMNYLPCEGETAALAAELGNTVTRAFGAGLSVQGMAGAVGAVGVRPEAIRFALGQTPAETWHGTATVEAVLPTGSNWTLQLRLGDATVYAVSNEPVTAPYGSEIDVWIRASDIHVFDRDDQRLEPSASDHESRVAAGERA